MDNLTEQRVVELSRGFLRGKLATLGAKGRNKSAASICHDFFKGAMDGMSNAVVLGPKAAVARGGKPTRFERAVTEYHRARKGQDYAFGLLKLIKGCLLEWISEAKRMKKLLTNKNTVIRSSEVPRVRQVLHLVEVSATILSTQSLQTIRDFALVRSVNFDVDVLEKKPYLITENGNNIGWTQWLKAKQIQARNAV